MKYTLEQRIEDANLRRVLEENCEYYNPPFNPMNAVATLM